MVSLLFSPSFYVSLKTQFSLDFMSFLYWQSSYSNYSLLLIFNSLNAIMTLCFCNFCLSLVRSNSVKFIPLSLAYDLIKCLTFKAFIRHPFPFSLQNSRSDSTHLGVSNYVSKVWWQHYFLQFSWSPQFTSWSTFQ